MVLLASCGVKDRETANSLTATTSNTTNPTTDTTSNTTTAKPTTTQTTTSQITTVQSTDTSNRTTPSSDPVDSSDPTDPTDPELVDSDTLSDGHIARPNDGKVYTIKTITDKNVTRNIATTTSDEGLAAYPVYGTNLDATDDEKTAINEENAKLLPSSTTYDSFDENGNALLNSVQTGKTLYKHTGSVGNYYGDVPNNRNAVEETFELHSRNGGNYVTGLYAAPGELIKVEVSQEALTMGGDLKILIGQATTSGGYNWSTRVQMKRMPQLVSVFTVTKTTMYIGSYLGGAIYIAHSRDIAAGKKLPIKFTGAVEYPHLVLGQTTKEEYESYIQNPAPYFDLEVPDRGIRISGPFKLLRSSPMNSSIRLPSGGRMSLLSPTRFQATTPRTQSPCFTTPSSSVPVPWPIRVLITSLLLISGWNTLLMSKP